MKVLGINLAWPNRRMALATVAVGIVAALFGLLLLRWIGQPEERARPFALQVFFFVTLGGLLAEAGLGPLKNGWRGVLGLAVVAAVISAVLHVFF